jgi:hypothetical protein
MLGPPKGPAASRVSNTRHRVIGTKRIAGEPLVVIPTVVESKAFIFAPPPPETLIVFIWGEGDAGGCAKLAPPASKSLRVQLVPAAARHRDLGETGSQRLRDHDGAAGGVGAAVTYCDQVRGCVRPLRETALWLSAAFNTAARQRFVEVPAQPEASRTAASPPYPARA